MLLALSQRVWVISMSESVKSNGRGQSSRITSTWKPREQRVINDHAYKMRCRQSRKVRLSGMLQRWTKIASRRMGLFLASGMFNLGAFVPYIVQRLPFTVASLVGDRNPAGQTLCESLFPATKAWSSSILTRISTSITELLVTIPRRAPKM